MLLRQKLRWPRSGSYAWRNGLTGEFLNDNFWGEPSVFDPVEYDLYVDGGQTHAEINSASEVLLFVNDGKLYARDAPVAGDSRLQVAAGIVRGV